MKRIRDARDDAFLDALRRPQPDPGGGSAAAHGALLGLAILEKIFRLEQRRCRAGSDEAQAWREGLGRVAELTGIFVDLRERDVRAYHGLAEALARRDRDAGSLVDALEEAIACPFAIMGRAEEAFDLVAEVGKGCRRFLVADVLVACELLGAALLGAFHIASANLPLMPAKAAHGEWLGRLAAARARGEQRLVRLRAELER